MSAPAIARADAGTTTGTSAPRRLRGLALPAEHGGWSLTLEPVLLGLLVAWSPAGLALGLAALLAFVARTPLKLVLVDRWRHRWLDRSATAAWILAAESAVLAGLVALAAVLGDGRFWIPLAAAAPLVVVQLWFDMRSRSRRMIPELAGTVGISAVVAAIVLADGQGIGLALGLWCVVAARAAAAIPYVRTQLMRGRGRPHRVWHSDAAQLLAVAAVVAGWALDATPLGGAAAVAAAAAVNVTLVRVRPRPPVVIGVQQTVVGVAVVAATAIAVLAG